MDIVEGFRKVVQDLLVPELKAMQVEIRHLNERLGKIEEKLEALHKEMDERFLKIDERFEALYREMNFRFNELKETQIKILEVLNIEPHISRLEAYYEGIKERLDRISPLLVKEKDLKYQKKKK